MGLIWIKLRSAQVLANNLCFLFAFLGLFGELLWSQGLGGVRHVFSAAPSKGEGSVTTREATAPEYDYNCLDPQRPGSLQIDSLEC